MLFCGFLRPWIWKILDNTSIYILYIIYILLNDKLFCPVTEVPPCHSWFHGAGSWIFEFLSFGGRRKLVDPFWNPSCGRGKHFDLF